MVERRCRRVSALETGMQCSDRYSAARSFRHSCLDSIKTWTGLPVEESIRMTVDGNKWRKYVHGVANHRIQDG